MAKKAVPGSVAKYFETLKRPPAAVREFFQEQGAKGGRIGGKVAAAGMTAEQRQARAQKASAAAAKARRAKAKAKKSNG